ncbi:Stp1/IreP family PP2C-type Ser/Thr phosphatase [Vallitalea okinawensis]|uniref:Stp1/IreP family PP2C-type Ser/Thr phosphatase n=1 Tax=Vallitalea okinawensis TaxID=2078660 RepID=UPI000CFC1201|nr:Stp1/IreP family PP2C-type Ser/Thr phosphatase [Vallitalea okinawensis]
MRYSSLCDTGKLRKINQDNIFCSSDEVGCLPNLYIVADGMGGHNAGELASQLSIEYFLVFLREQENQPCDIEMVLNKGIEKVNRLVYNKSLNDPHCQGMGTTFICATYKMDTQELYVANVGDSRLYAIGQEIKKVTVDHSLVEEMIKGGELTEQEARNHPKKNIITRAVGVESNLTVDTYIVDCKDMTHILLCSDGLTNMLDEEEMKKLIDQAGSVEEACRVLVEEANERGGYDNISVILIETQKEVGELNC